MKLKNLLLGASFALCGVTFGQTEDQTAVYAPDLGKTYFCDDTELIDGDDPVLNFLGEVTDVNGDAGLDVTSASAKIHGHPTWSLSGGPHIQCTPGGGWCIYIFYPLK